jgi:hypothetical protein
MQKCMEFFFNLYLFKAGNAVEFPKGNGSSHSINSVFHATNSNKLNTFMFTSSIGESYRKIGLDSKDLDFELLRIDVGTVAKDLRIR